MISRITWLIAMIAVFYGGYLGFRIALEQFTVEITTEKETPIEEQILLDKDLFFDDFGKKKIIHLRTFDERETFHIDGVSEPRPLLQEIVARHGEPERIEETDLREHGISQKATIFYYGRLGLGSPKSQGKIFWVILK